MNLSRLHRFLPRSWSRVTLVAVLLVSTLGVSGVAPMRWGSSTPAVAYAEKIDEAVWTALAETPDGKVPVFVKLAEQANLTDAAAIEDWTARGWAVYNALRITADRTQPVVLNQIALAEADGRATGTKSFWIVNAISVSADVTTLRTLAALPEVGAILPNAKLEAPIVIPGDTSSPDTIEWGVAKIRAPDVWTTYGVTGVGAVAANVDTGVQYDHPALVGHYRGNLGGGVFDHNYNWYDPTGVSPNVPADDNGHGTHTMGTMIGDDGGVNQIGVAPGAKWIAAYGCCPSNDALLEAQQFMIAPTDLAGNNPDPSKRPDVLNQSWGGPGGSEIFEGVIAALRASGVFPSFSAGNSGSTCGTLGSPGDNPSAFNVGATTSTDTIASFSSRGPNPFTGQTGPNVSAPGNGVRSSYPTNTYSSLSGTSMAAPHVAGAVALLISLEPKLRGRVAELEELLRKTAVPLTSAQTCGGVPGTQIPNNAFGWGRIDVKAAADMVYHAGYIQGTVTTGVTPLAGATVTYSMLGKTLTTKTDKNGFYKVAAGAGSWAMTAGAYGYQTASAPTVVVAQNGTTVQDFNLTALGNFTVSGSVTDSGSSLGVPALILVKNENLAAPVWADANGAYSLLVPPGTYTIEAQHPGYTTGSQSVTVAGATTANFSLVARSNYACIDSRQPGGPTYNWIDATDGTAYPLDDDASSAAITLPSAFTYFGTAYTTFRINSNGFVFFGATNYTTAHMFLPFEGRPNNDLMALGEDLNPALGAQGTIYAKAVGNLYVIEYYQVQHWASGFPETFEVIFDLSTGAITYQYNTVSWPDFTTVGLEDAAGAVGQLYSYRNSANLAAGRAVLFTPATGTAVNWGCDHALSVTIADDNDPVTAGDTITYSIHWNNIGFGGAPGATLTATIPPNTTFVSADGGIAPVSGVLTWNLGALRPKSEGSAWFKVLAVVGPTASTTATLADTSGQSRAATETTMIYQPTAVSLTSFSGGPATALFAPLAGLLLLVAAAAALRRRTIRP